MTRGVLAVVLAAVLVLSPLVAPVAVADEHGGNATDAGDNETTQDGGDAGAGGEEELKTTSEDPVLELQQSEFAVVHRIDRHDDYAVVTIRTTQPVSVDYPTQSREELGPNSQREIISTTERIPRGETQIRVPLTGESVFFTVDGATAQVSGDKTIDRSLVAYLSANQALLVGAALALSGAVVAGYRQKLSDDLDEPENAFRGGGKR